MFSNNITTVLDSFIRIDQRSKQTCCTFFYWMLLCVLLNCVPCDCVTYKVVCASVAEDRDIITELSEQKAFVGVGVLYVR